MPFSPFNNLSSFQLFLRRVAATRTLGQGNPDENLAARYVLKDYVKVKLLFSCLQFCVFKNRGDLFSPS